MEVIWKATMLALRVSGRSTKLIAGPAWLITGPNWMMAGPTRSTIQLEKGRSKNIKLMPILIRSGIQPKQK